jgi:rubredoxin
MSEKPYRKWECVICGFIYDEAEGFPKDGLPAGTRWEDVPETWECPDCGTSKFDFDMVPIA